MMDDMAPEPRHAASMRLTTGQWILSVIAAVLMLGLAALAFRGMFSSVRIAMVPYFGTLAWIVPIGVDLGIVILILVGILLEWLAMPMPPLRLIAGFFMGCTVWLNAVAAHGQAAGIIGHIALPVLFIACVEAVRHAVRRRSGIAEGTVREGIPLARWVLAPVSSWQINRRMILWKEPSYARALEREQLRWRTMARLRAHHGIKWRKLADQSVVRQLVHGIDVEGAAEAVRAALAAPAAVPPRASSPRKGKPSSPRRVPRTRPQPLPPDPDTGDLTAEMRALTIIEAEPAISGNELGRRLGTSERYGRDLKKRLAPVVAAERG